MDGFTHLSPGVLDDVLFTPAIHGTPAVGGPPHASALDLEANRPPQRVQNQKIELPFPVELFFALPAAPRKQEALAVDDRPRVG